MESNPAFDAEQALLLSQLVIPTEEEDFILTEGDLICTLDVQYKKEEAYVAIDVREWQSEAYSIFLSKEICTVPYQPGYFSFREGPILVEAIQKLTHKIKKTPKLLLIDGHGVAHPRNMGLASWVGIKLGIASIGIAKDSLLPVDYQFLDKAAGAMQKIIVAKEWVGTVLRTSSNVKPIFISAGHLISQKASLQICKTFKSEYRILAPIRMADQAARKFAKGEEDDTSIVL